MSEQYECIKVRDGKLVSSACYSYMAQWLLAPFYGNVTEFLRAKGSGCSSLYDGIVVRVVDGKEAGADGAVRCPEVALKLYATAAVINALATAEDMQIEKQEVEDHCVYTVTVKNTDQIPVLDSLLALAGSHEPTECIVKRGACEFELIVKDGKLEGGWCYLMISDWLTIPRWGDAVEFLPTKSRGCSVFDGFVVRCASGKDAGADEEVDKELFLKLSAVARVARALYSFSYNMSVEKRDSEDQTTYIFTIQDKRK